MSLNRTNNWVFDEDPIVPILRGSSGVEPSCLIPCYCWLRHRGKCVGWKVIFNSTWALVLKATFLRLFEPSLVIEGFALAAEKIHALRKNLHHGVKIWGFHTDDAASKVGARPG